MRYEEFAPKPEHAGVVACYWSFMVDGGGETTHDHVVVPDGTVSIVYIRGVTPPRRLLSLLGPRVDALRRPTSPGDIYWGVRLCPAVVEALLGIPARELRDRVENASERLLELSRRLLERLAHVESPSQARDVFQDELARLCRQIGRTDTVVFKAVRMLQESHGSAGITTVASRCCLSPRQFRRRFGDAVGLTPKEFARVQRIRWACIQSIRPGATPWAELAFLSGFADQAHLVREVGQMMGMSPKLLARRLGRIRHTNVRP
jgi:AraC-like DNA-binding protein